MPDLPIKLQHLLRIFKQHTALTDAELAHFYLTSKDPTLVRISETAMRNGREALVEHGLVRDSGKRKTNRLHRECILWELVDSAG